MLNWRGTEVEVARSAGGVLALSTPWENLRHTGVQPWPPPELIQKMYQSRHTAAFRGPEAAIATKALGFYSDLQSLHSEDAITWSVFGPIVYGTEAVRAAFAAALLRLIGLPGERVSAATVWLWRRLPHPDSLVPGGPEVDFGIQTDDVFLLGEAKWLSAVGASQGIDRNKDQFTLRREFCAKYGRRLIPGCRHFVVLAVSLAGSLIPTVDTEADGVALHARDAVWKDVVGLDAHPEASELRAYFSWKLSHSQAG
jgi:hypothetical protein